MLKQGDRKIQFKGPRNKLYPVELRMAKTSMESLNYLPINVVC